MPVYSRPLIADKVTKPAPKKTVTPPKKVTTVTPKPVPKPAPVVTKPPAVVKPPVVQRPYEAPKPPPPPPKPKPDLSRNPDPVSASIKPPDPVAQAVAQAGQLRNDQPVEKPKPALKPVATAPAPAAPQAALPRPDAPLPVARPAGKPAPVSQAAGRDLGLSTYQPTAPSMSASVAGSGYVPSPGYDRAEQNIQGARDEAAFIIQNQPGMGLNVAGRLPNPAFVNNKIVEETARMEAVRRADAIAANEAKRAAMFAQGADERYYELADNPNSIAYQSSTVRKATPAVTNKPAMRPGFQYMPWEDVGSLATAANRQSYTPLTQAQQADRDRWAALAIALQNYERPTYQAQDRPNDVVQAAARPNYDFSLGSDEMAFIQANQPGLAPVAGGPSQMDYVASRRPVVGERPTMNMSGYVPAPGYQRPSFDFSLGSDEAALQQVWQPSTPAGSASTMDYVASRTPTVGVRPQGVQGLPVAPPSANRNAYETPTSTVRGLEVIVDQPRNPLIPPRNPGGFEPPPAPEGGNPNPPGWRQDGYGNIGAQPPADPPPDEGGDPPVNIGLDDEQLAALLALIDSESALRAAELNQAGSDAELALSDYERQLTAAEREQIRRAENLAAERGLSRSGIFAGAVGDVATDFYGARTNAQSETALTMDDIQRALNLLTSETESKKAYAREENARGGLELREGERIADLLTRLPLDPTAPPGVRVPTAPILTSAQIPQFPTLGALTSTGTALPPLDSLIRRYASRGSSRNQVT